MPSRRKSPRTNLPVERGAFVGRARALEEVGRRVDGGERLLSIVGPTGIGKTRLAVRAMALELPRFGYAGGAFCVDATELKDAAALLRECLAVVSDQEPHAEPAFHTRMRFLDLVNEAGATLLVLDGLAAELPAMAQLLESLVADAPQLYIWLTAHQPLGVAGEAVVRLSSLPLPKQGQETRAQHNDAVALFVDRAAQVRRGYEPTHADLFAIAQIVRLLDGVPLAIEVAAARMKSLTATELLERLPRNVSRLVHHSSSAPPRAALAGAVAWSVELLSAAELSCLAQAAVFRGGFDEDAATDIIELRGYEDGGTVAAVVESLLEKALLRVVEPAVRVERGVMTRQSRRVDMPSVVREFAETRVASEKERVALVQRHTNYFLRVGAAWAEGVDGHGGSLLRRLLVNEFENILAVGRRALHTDPQTLASVTTALRAALIVEPVLLVRGPIEVFVELLDRALEPAEVVGVSLQLRARAHEARARAHRALYQLPASLEDLQTALSLARRTRDRLTEARALANIGTHHVLVGALDTAESEYRDALVLMREVRDRRLLGRGLGFLGWLYAVRGQIDDAVVQYQEAIAIHREVGDRRFEGLHTAQLAAAMLARADASQAVLEDAMGKLRHALLVHKELANRRAEAQALLWLGDAHVLLHEFDDGKEAWERAQLVARQSGDARVELLALARVGAMAQRVGERALAEELFLRARKLSERLDDASVLDAVAVLERRTLVSERPSEPRRAAERVVRVLTT